MSGLRTAMLIVRHTLYITLNSKQASAASCVFVHRFRVVSQAMLGYFSPCGSIGPIAETVIALRIIASKRFGTCILGSWRLWRWEISQCWVGKHIGWTASESLLSSRALEMSEGPLHIFQDMYAHTCSTYSLLPEHKPLSVCSWQRALRPRSLDLRSYNELIVSPLH